MTGGRISPTWVIGAWSLIRISDFGLRILFGFWVLDFRSLPARIIRRKQYRIFFVDWQRGVAAEATVGGAGGVDVVAEAGVAGAAAVGGGLEFGVAVGVENVLAFVVVVVGIGGGHLGGGRVVGGAHHIVLPAARAGVDVGD